MLMLRGHLMIGQGTQLDLVENDIYTLVISDINPGDQIEFKFRIDGDWGNSEFPGGGYKSFI